MEQENVLSQIIEGLKAEEVALQKQLAFFNGQLQYNQKLQVSCKKFQQHMNETSKKDSSNPSKRKSRK